MEWNEINTKYWDEISNSYEDLYNDNWSKLEDRFIQNELCNIVKNKDSVLDLGCGLCLGYDLVREIYANINYTGVDISNSMVAKAKSKNKKIHVLNSSMSCLSSIADNSIDVVISINTSFSFTDSIQNTISEIKRVLKKNGKIFISVLSKWSFRRILKLKLGNTEKYSTRNTKANKHSYSWVFSTTTLKKVFSDNGFEIIDVKGYNSFVGLIQTNWTWRLNLLVSKIFPNLSHDLILTATYK